MIITTTPSVEGYNISRYIGTVSGTGTYLVAGFIGEGMISSRQAAQFSAAWQEAVEFMRKAAGNADAIVGVQHTLCGVANGYMIVSVTGTAVKLVEDPVYRVQMEQAKQNEIEMKARREEAARLSLEAHQREQEQKQRDLEEKILNSLADGQTVSMPTSVMDRQKLIVEIAYATNLLSVSRVRAKLKQIDLESGKEVIDFLLSLSDDELKPVANAMMKKLKDEA